MLGSMSDPVPALARSLPKVELHCHLEGSARPATIVELAKKNGVALPVDDPTELFHFDDLNSFLAVYGIICQSLVTADDFRRITYEALEDAVADRVRYREMFFSPSFAMAYGVALETVWDGIRAGLAEAHADLDVRCRMVLDVDKGGAPSAATDLVAFAAQQDRDLIVGIGGDSTERGVDHSTFLPAYELAARQGLRRTMHAGEDGPAENIAISLDVLGCERIDHGVRLIDDPELMARVAEARIPLTVCPLSNVLIARMIDDVAEHPFARQREAGVLVTVNSDDPGMTGTTISDDYEHVARAFSYDLDTMEQLALDGIEACWAPDDEKAALRTRFLAEFDAGRADADMAVRGMS
ncbi:MAG: Adenosine deaminase [Acidimicrobiales bacterium]|nr:Adenosine deaminase [Acidimicrobiales bacterium]